jgi:hypothetical protein
MNPEQRFIRDLISLCEQHGMAVSFYSGDEGDIAGAHISHRNEDEYHEVLKMIRELQ